MHIPVLERELLDQFSFLKGDAIVVDCTLGEGGHADGLLSSNANIHVVGIERDSHLAKNTREKLTKKYGERITVINDSYTNLKDILSKHELLLPESIKVIYFDLGACLWHYKDSGRGFSFKLKEPLDMRFNKKSGRKASDIVADSSKEELIDIFNDYGEVKFSRSIVNAIYKKRKSSKIKNTQDLIEIITNALSGKPETLKNREIRKVFQALRIATNDELGSMMVGIKQAVEVVALGGRVAVITYHSTEDRMVKRFFANTDIVFSVIKKPIQPTLMEKRFNISSRSAKLRVVEKQINNKK